MKAKKPIKEFVLRYKCLYEAYFALAGKTINRRRLDKKIAQFLEKKPSTIKTCIPDVIISLTSYGERIPDLKFTLYSLVNQSVLPEKIIVWLAHKEIVPPELYLFERYGVEFHFCDDTRSYKKLIPALKHYSQKYIVTADDDIFYNKHWLKKLWKCHLQHPEAKITHIAHKIRFDEQGKLLPYVNWLHNVRAAPSGKMYFPTGCGGTLYPPQPVPPDFLDENLFMKLCPNADDVWFYFMGLFSGQETVVIPHPYNRLRYVDIYKEYGLNGKSTLQAVNVEQNLNDVQIRNVMNHFGLSDETLNNFLRTISTQCDIKKHSDER